MIILGVSALYHDSAAALIVDGEIIAAAQEERFSRRKHDADIPINAMRYCLKEAQKYSREIDAICFYDNPILTLDRYMNNLRNNKNYERIMSNSFDNVFSKRLWVHKLIQNEFGELANTSFYVIKHHLSHAASAFYPSPYKKSVIITMDGVGEWTTLSIGVGDDNKISLFEEIKYPHSIGLFYSAFTYYCGFKVNSGDYKFMGLAPYGEPKYYQLILDNIIFVNDDGSFYLNMDYFDYQNGGTMINEHKFAELFGTGRRQPESRITEKEMNIASSVQKITEEIIFKIVNYAKKKYGKETDNLVLAGGVALNCVSNGKLLTSKVFKNIWIQPASGDAGGSIGAPLYYYFDYLNMPRMTNDKADNQKGSYLGPEYTEQEICDFLEKNNYKYHKPDDFTAYVAKLLNEQKVIGLFHGRMEFGPRALGNRSIIADPRSEDMQAHLNLKIKYRESFRPFAPSVLRERVNDYFELNEDSPYMLFCANVKENRRVRFDLKEQLSDYEMDMLPVVRSKRSDIPAVTHVDYSARIQTVDRVTNPWYYDIIKAFESLTGCGLVINTSFNVRGEPIVCTPNDAYQCFMRSDMDVLALEGLILFKEEQQKIKDDDWRSKYELD